MFPGGVGSVAFAMLVAFTTGGAGGATRVAFAGPAGGAGAVAFTAGAATSVALPGGVGGVGRVPLAGGGGGAANVAFASGGGGAVTLAGGTGGDGGGGGADTVVETELVVDALVLTVLPEAFVADDEADDTELELAVSSARFASPAWIVFCCAPNVVAAWGHPTPEPLKFWSVTVAALRRAS